MLYRGLQRSKHQLQQLWAHLQPMMDRATMRQKLLVGEIKKDYEVCQGDELKELANKSLCLLERRRGSISGNF